MLRSKAIAGLIRPMRQLGISRVRVSISSCSQTAMIPAPANENYLPDHFNKQAMSQYIEKDAEGTHKLQITHNASKTDKISVLVTTFLDLENSREAVYGALDAWVVGQQNFPIGLLKTALLRLEKGQQWHKAVQVIKWMLSKGQGVTVGTYGQLIRALDMDHRVEEANNLWVKKLGRDLQSVPWKVCEIMISVYYRNGMWKELVKLFKGLEACGRKPPVRSIVQKVAESYEKLGLLDEKERVLEKHMSLFTKRRGKYGMKPSKMLSKSTITKVSS